MIVVRGYLLHRRRAKSAAQFAAKRKLPTARWGGPRHWLWWAVRDEIESGWLFLREAFDEHVPLPATWDRAVSRWVALRRERRWPGWQHSDIELPGCCAVCAARWLAGRPRKHPACLQAIKHATEVAVSRR